MDSMTTGLKVRLRRRRLAPLAIATGFSLLLGCSRSGNGGSDAAPTTAVTSALAPDFGDQTWLAQSVFRTGTGWFSQSTHQRMWTGDVNADGKSDFVGIDSDGKVWVAASTGSSFTAGSVWLTASIFTVAAQWFTTAHWDRVHLVDVTGDGRADLVGIASDGGIWVSESTGTAFTPSHFVAASSFSTPAYFDRALQHRVFLGDVDGDDRTDIAGISTSGQIFVSRATGSGTTAAFAATALYAAGSAFVAGQDWFQLSSHPRVWLADVTGDGKDDFVGIDFAGHIRASQSLGTSFGPSTNVLADTALKTDPADERYSLFAVTSHPRIWLADVNGDGCKDIVGIAPGDATGGVGDGDVWGEIAPCSGTLAIFKQRVLLSESVYRTSMGWFYTGQLPRLWVEDVTADGRADLVGVSNDGGIWVASSTMEQASPGAPAGMNGTRDFFLPPARTGASGFQSSAGFFDSGSQRRIWLADFTGDGVKDLVGIAPGGGPGGLADGDMVWRMGAPAQPVSVTSINRTAIEAGTPQAIQISFSRRMTPGSLSLTAQQDGAAIPASLAGTTARTATWNVSFTPKGTAATQVSLTLSAAARDGWGQHVDLDGDLLDDNGAGPGFTRRRWWNGQLLAGTSKVNLVNSYPAGTQWLPFPSGYGYLPSFSFPNTYPASANPPMARVVVMAGGGVCTTTSNCRSGQTCAAGQCQLAGADANAPLVLINADLVGMASGRLNELVARRYGIPKQNVIVAATHAHAVYRNIKLFTSPYFDDHTAGDIAHSYESWMEEKIADSVGAAMATMSAVELATGSDPTPPASPPREDFCNSAPPPASVHLGFNRRLNSYGTLDREAKVIKLRSPSLAVTFLNFALHPVVEYSTDDPSPAEVNADFPGHMAAELEEDCGGVEGCAAMFLNGSAGDVDPELTCGTRTCCEPEQYSCEETRDGEENPVPSVCEQKGCRCVGADTCICPRFHESSSEIGQALAGVARGLSHSFSSTQGMSIVVEKHIVTHPGFSGCRNLNNDTDPQNRQTLAVDWELESTAFSIGVPGAAPKVRAATLPGEPFSRLALFLKANAPGAFLIGYANGYAGYLPDRSAWNDAVVAGCGPTGGGPTCYGIAACNGPSFLDNSTIRTPGERLIDGAIDALMNRL